MSIAQYEPIKITGMDTDRTRKDEQSALHYVFLSLSPQPTAAWASDFNETWAQHFYMQKRRALVQGDGLVVHCHLDELDDGLVTELEKITGEVNERQRTLAAKARDDEANAKAVERKERKRIKDAADRFNKRP
ncbi:hypothetical protein RGUI_1084 [Rhodovulum sp. P5]|uniref:hypothetical protein n=1 Tax=Rhodovulum sp. P5 TaxID=1564506 RepID=UPI0009C1C359|nr:hypothetical protein [Rhodovulum sp. P5]ARE39225.1 hypothetical protein RGUI_1084 [Rhodovulum sp. P5]